MITVNQKNQVVITTDIQPCNVPDLQNSIIRMLQKLDKQLINSEHFNEDLSYMMLLLEALTMNEHQAEIGLQLSPGRFRAALKLTESEVTEINNKRKDESY